MTEPSRDTAHEIMIEGRTHPWDADSLTVADIRRLGGLPDNAPVIEEDLRDGAQRTLPDDEVIHPGPLQEGERPKKRVNFRAG